MKNLLTIFITLFALSANAKNYYISNAGSDAATGLTSATAWQTIAKLNASWSSVAAGDSILFRRGDVFYGAVIIGKSGTSTSSIVISAYGSGTKPLISGFTTLSGWTNNGNGVWQASAANVKNTVNLVTINGMPQQVGRYPNSDAAGGGYLKYENYNGRTSITDNELTATTNWAGAEICMKKEGYILERDLITAHSGNTITYTTIPSINPRNNSSYPAEPSQAGFGYFIQRDSRTLDKMGEWYFNTTDKVIQVYFGTNTPASYTVKVSSIDTLINIGNKAYIKVDNIALEGSNLAALYTQDASNITVQYCDVYNSGAKGIFFWNTPNTLIENCTIKYAACGGIDVTGRYAANVTVRGCTVKNIATMAGMGSFYDDADMNGIFVSVSTTALVEKNIVDTVGYIGIHFQGNGITIQKNYVNYHDFVKDDGGGIYTYATTATGRIIQDNIILNGIGSTAGNAFPTHAEGIYCDGGARGITIKNNTVAFHSDRGIYMNDPKDISVSSNTCFSNGWSGLSNGTGGFGIQKHYGDSIYNCTIKNNIFYSLYNYQGNFTYFNSGLNSGNRPVASTIQSALQLVAIIDSNYYNTSKTGSFNWSYQQVSDGAYTFPTPSTFEVWKTFSAQDAHSKRPVKIVGTDSVKFVYNATTAAVTNSLDANYIAVDGTAYNGTITLQPYTSAILLKSSALLGPVVDAGNDVIVSLPIDSTILSGTVSGTVSSYEWTKVSGPSQYTISSPASKTTVIDNLTAGTYTFRLKVTNAAGASAIDTVHVVASGILPVTLVSFTGRNAGEKNELKWKTNTEVNSSHYTIQKSSNGTDFVNIGNVNSRNSTLENNYGFNDNVPFKGNNYYRLAMVDRDGSTAFSRIVVIQGQGTKSFSADNVSLSSSAGTIKFTLNSNEKQPLNYTIVDVAGRVIISKAVILQQGLNNISNEVPGIRAGIYYVKFFTITDIITKTVLAQQ